MNTLDMTNTIHEGRNLKRFREMFGIKQQTLAEMMGLKTQQDISNMEKKGKLDPDVKLAAAKALKIPVEAIENFDEESAVNIISNTFTDQSILNGINYNPTFNPIDKLVEVVDENKKLYERLLQSEKEKVGLLESILKNRN
jgi:DNA-binding XRE family transcriptional regulator